MFKSQQYRAKAAQYGELPNGSTRPDQRRRFQELENRFASLADNEQELADKYDDEVKTFEQDRAHGEALGDEEEHLRHCRVGRYAIGDSLAPRANRPVSTQA
jgi:hypothetical protein